MKTKINQLLLIATLLFSSYALQAQTNSYCLFFDGVDDYALAPASVMGLVSNGNFTIETWMQGGFSQTPNLTILSNRSAAGGSGIVLSLNQPPAGGNFRILTLQIGGTSYAIPNNGSYNASLLDNNCHHIAVTRKNTNLVFFIDGNVIGQTQISNTQVSVDSGFPLQIGANIAANSFFAGKLWEIRIWNDTRPDSDILATKDTYLLGNENWLIANWPFNEGAGQIAYDFSLYNHDLFLGGSDCGETGDPVWMNNICPLQNPFIDQNCPEDIVHAEPFSATQQVYQSANSIQSTAVIEQNEFVTYNATICIELQPGFEVQSNATFEAVIGGCVPATPACLELKEPAEQAIVQSCSPVFSWNIDPAQLEACPAPYQYEITILRVGNALRTRDAIANNQIAFNTTFTVQDASIQTMSFPNLLLVENENYIWNIQFNSCPVPVFACKWKHFYHSQIPLQLPFEPDDDLCLSDCMLVNESSFDRNPSFVWNFEQGTPTIDSAGEGCDDPGYIILAASPGTSDIISQTLLYPINQDAHYQLSVCFQTSSTNVRIQAMAFNGSPTSFDVGTDVALIGQTGHLPPSTEWSTFQFPVWTSNKDFTKLAILLIHDNPQGGSEVLMDNVCIAEVPENPCEEYEIVLDENGDYTLPGYIGDLIATYMPNVVETETEYITGSTSDLYGHLADTETDTWYAENMPPCASIGEYDPQDQIDSIINTVDTTALGEILELGDGSEVVEMALTKENSVLFDELNPVPQIHPVPEQSPCGNTVEPRPGLPFGGRDIVYVHGLQLDHLFSSISGDFLGEWPTDSPEFYVGGEFHNHAMTIVGDHIADKLGSLTDPTNSYLVVSYSAGQRLKYGIHSVLSQISDAINNASYPGAGGTDPTGVVWARDPIKECFGDEIVIVTHSTGGLLVSSMLGLGELSATDLEIQEDYGNVKSITDRIKVHVAVEGAFSGSRLASAGIALSTGLSPTVTLIDEVFEIFGAPFSLSSLAPDEITSSILTDLTPPVAQYHWGNNYYQFTSTPTFTAAGGFPGLSGDDPVFWPTKFIVNGLDDGVLNMDCACASKHTHLFHSRFTSSKPGKMIDFGRPFFLKSLGLLTEQKISSGLYNSACISHLSPTGMLLPVTTPAPITRWPNHYSVTQSTATHFDPSKHILRNGKDYAKTVSGIPNFEEVRVITNPAIYTWVHPSFATKVNEHVKKKTIGFHIPWIKKKKGFPWFKFTWKYIEITIWKRTYHLLDNYENMRDLDYLYEYVLKP